MRITEDPNSSVRIARHGGDGGVADKRAHDQICRPAVRCKCCHVGSDCQHKVANGSCGHRMTRVPRYPVKHERKIVVGRWTLRVGTIMVIWALRLGKGRWAKLGKLGPARFSFFFFCIFFFLSFLNLGFQILNSNFVVEFILGPKIQVHIPVCSCTFICLYIFYLYLYSTFLPFLILFMSNC
jgi:hypothetical protein